jgi:hypothetical protein
MHVKK